MNAWRLLILSQLRAPKIFIFDYSDRLLGSAAKSPRVELLSLNNMVLVCEGVSMLETQQEFFIRARPVYFFLQ